MQRPYLHDNTGIHFDLVLASEKEKNRSPSAAPIIKTLSLFDSCVFLQTFSDDKWHQKTNTMPCLHLPLSGAALEKAPVL